MLLNQQSSEYSDLEAQVKSELEKIADSKLDPNTSVELFESEKISQFTAKVALIPEISQIDVPKYIFLAFLRYNKYDIDESVKRIHLYLKNSSYVTNTMNLKTKLDSDWVFCEGFKK